MQGLLSVLTEPRFWLFLFVVIVVASGLSVLVVSIIAKIFPLENPFTGRGKYRKAKRRERGLVRRPRPGCILDKCYSSFCRSK